MFAAIAKGLFTFLGGPIVTKAVDAGVRFIERRAERAEARHIANLQLEAKRATADIDWEQHSLRSMLNSWKDEVGFLWVLGVLTLVLLPQTQETALAGLRGLQEAPVWFQAIVGAAFASTFGVKDLIKYATGRKS